MKYKQQIFALVLGLTLVQITFSHFTDIDYFTDESLRIENNNETSTVSSKEYLRNTSQTNTQFTSETLPSSNDYYETTYQASLDNVFTGIVNSSTSLPDSIMIKENEHKLNSSFVIVWGKCGQEARTQVTQIFQSVYYNKTVSLSYDPSINVLIYQVIDQGNKTKQVLKLPNIAGELLFFLFNEPSKINIFLGCPGSSKNRLVLDFDSDVEYVSVYQNAKAFESLSAASAAFKCSTTISIVPGTIIHFDSFAISSITILLISFTFDKEVFSLTLQNGNIFITTSTQQTITLTINQIVVSGLYLVFTATGLQFYVNCPSKISFANSAAFWNTTIFSKKLNIETSQHYYYGSAASSVLLSAFCSTNNLINLINNQSCISSDKIDINLNLVESANKFTSSFTPDQNKINQIELFNINNPLNFGNLIENEPKILFASRDHSDPDFFNKNLQQYVEGFSDGQSNYWIGLDILHKVTYENDYILRIVATSVHEFDYVEEYSWFKIGSSKEGYKLSVAGLLSCCDGWFSYHNGALFSTYDNNIQSDLARKFSSGFWHINNKKYCFSCIENNFPEGSSTNVWLSNAQNIQIFKTKMYLVPSSMNLENYMLNSFIIDESIKNDFYSLFGKRRFTLLYRASQDGFKASVFHDKCDGISKTVILIKSTLNYIFGGYTEAIWNRSGAFITDSKAFLFSLKNSINRAKIFRVKTGANAIYCHPSLGPTFGSGHDLYIVDNFNISSSYTNLGNSYDLNEISLLAEGSNFKVKELEVFQAI